MDPKPALLTTEYSSIVNKAKVASRKTWGIRTIADAAEWAVIEGHPDNFPALSAAAPTTPFFSLRDRRLYQEAMSATSGTDISVASTGPGGSIDTTNILTSTDEPHGEQ
jgi:hypothetical protein